VGFDFAHNDVAYLKRCKTHRHFRVASTIYDLIPVRAPQFVTRDFSGYYEDAIGVSDVALVISQATARDMDAFASERGIVAPEIVEIRLGSGLALLPPTKPRALPARVAGEFVLCVGSITLRKNPHLLLDVWSALVNERGVDWTPRLVFCGAVGQLSSEAMARIEREPQLSDAVVHLVDATDHELAWLYRECAFTVFPSMFEGWGLPVTESLDFGKVCLSSNRTSLPEAGEGLAVLLDPTDREAWLSEVRNLLEHPDLRTEREEEIRRRHVIQTPQATAQAIVDALLDRVLER
jgi:glycosyltransferase involved in cell wall biosynthesis